jgi:hypothetical protein
MIHALDCMPIIDHDSNRASCRRLFQNVPRELNPCHMRVSCGSSSSEHWDQVPYVESENRGSGRCQIILLTRSALRGSFRSSAWHCVDGIRGLDSTHLICLEKRPRELLTIRSLEIAWMLEITVGIREDARAPPCHMAVKGLLVVIIIHLLGQAPEGCLAPPNPSPQASLEWNSPRDHPRHYPYHSQIAFTRGRHEGFPQQSRA